MKYKRVTVTVEPGTVPEPDATNLASIAWINGDKYRFYGGVPQSIGASATVTLDDDIAGVCRLLYGYSAGNNKWVLAGTHTRLHSILAGGVTNITPLVTSTTALPNDPIGALYRTVTGNDFGTTSGSTTVELLQFGTNATAFFRVGDIVVISGATGTHNGIPAAELNGTQIIRSINTYPEIEVTTPATSTGISDDLGATYATYICHVEDTAHGLSDGDRVKIAGISGTVGGVPDTDINKEHIIRDVNDVDYYGIVVDTLTTSNASGGGASGTRQEQIAAGDADSVTPEGWGVGEWGSGNWGDPPVDPTTFTVPRIYSADRFGNNIVLTPGNEGKLYEWDGDTDVAPAVVSGAPTDINWVFVDNNKVNVLGPGNRIRCCDSGDNITWTPAASNECIDRYIYAADEWIGAVKYRDTHLPFTAAGQLWEHRYIGGNDIYLNRLIDTYNGPVAPKAWCTVNGDAYWMGRDNFYHYAGAVVGTLPCTVRNYIFAGDNKLNMGQAYKVHARYVKEFNEIWWHYPSGTENDRYVIYNISERTWAIGAMDRTAGEENGQLFDNPLTIDSSGVLYSEEENDSTTATTATVTVSTKLRPQSSEEFTTGALDITATTEKVDFRLHGRQRKMRIDFTTGAGVDGYIETNYGMIGEGDNTFHLLSIEPDSIQTPELFRMGRWTETMALSGKR